VIVGGSISGVNRLVPGLIERLGDTKSTQATNPVDKQASFTEVLSNMLESTNNLHADAAQAQEALIAGEPVELHQVMIKAQEAGVAMDLLLEIRNKLLDMYNEIMRMPM